MSERTVPEIIDCLERYCACPEDDSFVCLNCQAANALKRLSEPCGDSWTGNFGPTLVCELPKGHRGVHVSKGHPSWAKP